MPLPIEERDEVIVTNDSLELMQELRKELSNNFPKTWIFIHKDEIQKRYGIEVSNIWGGNLDDISIEPIQDFIENFMVEKKVNFVEKNA